MGVCWVCVVGFFGSGGEGYNGGPCKKFLKSFPGFKSDLPLAKAKPINDGGRASMITYLRRGT